ncbi:MAG: cell wall hydrolase [Alphaproteobacteria bacterium]|nr:cell wall hydrolase [Alphaproteobacteria bacterium]
MENERTILSRHVDVLARTIYGEARGEGLVGMEAVALVIINRVKKAESRGGRYWWGSTVEEVCLKSWQFSCWNHNDPNRKKLEKIDSSNPVFCTCERIARRAIARMIEDKTFGATHYHNKYVYPFWAQGLIPCAEIKNHLFYNDVK